MTTQTCVWIEHLTGSSTGVWEYKVCTYAPNHITLMELRCATEVFFAFRSFVWFGSR
jgi:hypothetical protein